MNLSACMMAGGSEICSSAKCAVKAKLKIFYVWQGRVLHKALPPPNELQASSIPPQSRGVSAHIYRPYQSGTLWDVTLKKDLKRIQKTHALSHTGRTQHVVRGKPHRPFVAQTNVMHDRTDTTTTREGHQPGRLELRICTRGESPFCCYTMLFWTVGLGDEYCTNQRGWGEEGC